MTELEALRVMNNPRENYCKAIWVQAAFTLRKFIEKNSNKDMGVKNVQQVVQEH